MVSKLDSYIIAKFAEWALDMKYYDEMINQFHTLQDDNLDPKSISDALAIMTIESMLSERKKKKITKDNVAIQGISDINEKKRKLPINFIEFTNMRGTIWRNSEVSFVFRAYLTNLEFEKKLQENVLQFVTGDVDFSRKSIYYQGSEGRICYTLKLDEMALLEIIAFSCDPEWCKGGIGVKNFFKKIILSIDPKTQLTEKQV